MDDVQNAVADAGAEVDDLGPPVRLGIAQRGEVALRQIDYVDIIAHAGTVVRRVVITKHTKALPFADSHLGDIRHEVIRYAVRVLADTSGRMRADRIEVTQQHHVPLRVSFLQVYHHLLEHGLRLSVRVRALSLGAVFGDRDDSGVAIDGCGGREDDVLAVMTTHHIQQHERAVEVILVILERLGD